jgi:hypothetical protein
VHRVDGLVARHRALDQGAVSLDQPLDRDADLLLGEAAHLEQARLELFELLLEVSNDASFHRVH